MQLLVLTARIGRRPSPPMHGMRPTWAAFEWTGEFPQGPLAGKSHRNFTREHLLRSVAHSIFSTSLVIRAL